jgi:plasmid maintenance system killer protein
MDITFSSSRQEKEFNTDRELVWSHGQLRAKTIMKRMAQLAAADNLEQLRNAPGRCHLLKGDLAQTFSIDLDGPYRLLFESTEYPPPQMQDGTIDWTQITSIRILEVRDTHE